MVNEKKTNFNWRIVVIYGSPYEDGKQAFLEELNTVMEEWHGPTLIGGDFNLCRFSTDKSNKSINHKWSNSFND